MNQYLEYQFAVVLLVCMMVETFCCCISLDAGAKVISVVSTLMSLMILVLYGCPILMLKLHTAKIFFYAIMVVAAGLQCLFGMLLCCGAFLRRPKLMWPWLIVVWITGLTLLGVCVVGYALLIMQRSVTTDANMVMSAYVIYSLYLLYCAFVVNNRRLELIKEEEEKPFQPLMVPTVFKQASVV